MAEDKQGNVLLPNMVLVGDVYYVRRMLRGKIHKISLGQKNWKKAQQQYHKIMSQLDDQKLKKVKSYRIEEYWTEHYRPAYTVRKTPMAGTTDRFRDDNLMVAALKELGNLDLADITKTMAQKFVNKRRKAHYPIYSQKPGTEKRVLYTKPVQEGTVAREVELLHAIFQQAIDDGHLEKNPWKNIDLLPAVPKDRVLSPDEQAKLEAVLSPRYQRWLRFMLGTGLRVAEARGIDPSRDVDFPKRFVRVTRKTRGLVKKTQAVPLVDDALLDILQQQLTEEGQLWPATTGRFRRLMHYSAKRAGIKELTPHALRHTFATRYLQAGGDIYILSKILGHSSVAITERVYAHLLGEDLLLRSRGIKLGIGESAPGVVLPFRKEA